MKKTTILYLLFSLLFFTSCNDWLDIRPENETVLEDYWQSESQATQVLASCYRGLTTDACMDRMIVWGELRSDDFDQGNTTNASILDILNVNITPTNTYADWGSFYTIINYCNTFLRFAPGVVDKDQNFTPTKLHTLEAEAKALRAMCYFYLVRTFRDVPLITEASISDAQDYFVGKSPEREVLDTIISDLKFAQKYARTDFGKGDYNKGRITLNAVNALLADVYLWDQQYANCIDACNQVLADNSLTLVDGENVIHDVFYQGNSTESILELQFNIYVQNNNMVNYYYGNSSNIIGGLNYPLYLTNGAITSPFNFTVGAGKESENDIREWSSYSQSDNEFGGFSIYKYALSQIAQSADRTTYTKKYRPSNESVNWIIYRLSDVMLMKAEALIEMENTQSNMEAMKLINTTYKRSNPTADSLSINNYTDKFALEQLVLRERQRELLFEGKRWFDLMRVVRRKGDPTVIVGYLAPKIQDALAISKLSVIDALYMPISKGQIDINPNLIQNPFYEDNNLTN